MLCWYTCVLLVNTEETGMGQGKLKINSGGRSKVFNADKAALGIF